MDIYIHTHSPLSPASRPTSNTFTRSKTNTCRQAHTDASAREFRVMDVLQYTCTCMYIHIYVCMYV